ncbi:MAG: hypothetical protein DMD46_14655 [Gemmatimonadetes bacterium]|nr:MAG: hypothetical protein DMD46_14655 [Gemmatimonadota bacterium]
MYVSSDGDKSWEQWTDLKHEIGGYPDLLVLHPRQPELMFVASAEKGPGSWRREHYAGSRISRSTDGAATTAARTGTRSSAAWRPSPRAITTRPSSPPEHDPRLE